MSKRLRSARPSSKGRLLRPRSERSASSEATPSSDNAPSDPGATSSLDFSTAPPPVVDIREKEGDEAPPSSRRLGGTSLALGTPAAFAASSTVSSAVDVPSAPAPRGSASVEVVAPTEKPTEAPKADAKADKSPGVSAEKTADKTADADPTSSKKADGKSDAHDEPSSGAEQDVEATSSPSSGASSSEKAEKAEKAEETETTKLPEVSPKKKNKKGGREAATSSPPSSASSKSGSHKALSDSDEFSKMEFFSVPPPAHDAHGHEADLDHGHEAVRVLTPEAVARQKKMRQLVLGVVGVAAVLALIGLGRAFSGDRASAHDGGASASKTSGAAPTTPTQAQKPSATLPTTDVASAAPSAEVPSAEVPSAEASSSAEVPSAEPSASAAAPGGALSAEELKDLKKRATAAINRSDNKTAIDLSTQAIAADPEDALMYLFLGSAYQSLGKMKEAREAFNECVRKGKGPHVGECSAMGGRK